MTSHIRTWVVVFGRVGGIVVSPGRVAMDTEVAKFEAGDGQAYDGGFVELSGDGVRKRKHLPKRVKLEVLLPATRSRRVTRLLLAQLQDAETRNAVQRSTHKTSNARKYRSNLCKFLQFFGK